MTGAPGWPPGSPVTAYVASGGMLSPMATATATAWPIPVGEAPNDIAITPDGTTA